MQFIVIKLYTYRINRALVECFPVWSAWYRPRCMHASAAAGPVVYMLQHL